MNLVLYRKTLMLTPQRNNFATDKTSSSLYSQQFAAVSLSQTSSYCALGPIPPFSWLNVAFPGSLIHEWRRLLTVAQSISYIIDATVISVHYQRRCSTIDALLPTSRYKASLSTLASGGFARDAHSHESSLHRWPSTDVSPATPSKRRCSTNPPIPMLLQRCSFSYAPSAMPLRRCATTDAPQQKSTRYGLPEKLNEREASNDLSRNE